MIKEKKYAVGLQEPQSCIRVQKMVQPGRSGCIPAILVSRKERTIARTSIIPTSNQSLCNGIQISQGCVP